MVLTDEQARHFYELWIPLLDYVNRRHRIGKSIYGMHLPEGLPIDAEERSIREKLRTIQKEQKSHQQRKSKRKDWER